MKQHIDLKQLCELKQEILLKLTKIVLGDIHYKELKKGNKNYVIALLSLALTIGKMIEVLEDNIFYWGLFQNEKRRDGTNYENVVIKIKDKSECMGFNNTELCDSLFEALCYMLGDEEYEQ